MPRVTHSSLEAVLAAFSTRDHIVVPSFEGRRGHPVVFGARYFGALRQLGGDTGAREILKQHAALVREVPVNDPGVLLDVDTPQDLAGAASGLPRAPT
jgi:molybdenum cofactor cytidylyltransferase